MCKSWLLIFPDGFSAVQQQVLSLIRLLKLEGRKPQICSVPFGCTCRMPGTSQISSPVARYQRSIAGGTAAAGHGTSAPVVLENTTSCKDALTKYKLECRSSPKTKKQREKEEEWINLQQITLLLRLIHFKSRIKIFLTGLSEMKICGATN